jgi:iron(III) transport system permease protein
MSDRQSPVIIGLAGLLVAAVCLPIFTILVLAISGQGGGWPANLGSLLSTTVLLAFGAAFVALVVGTVLAWLVTYYNFPGRSLLRWMALLPLALPSYIISFVYVEAFTYAGPFQQFLRDSMGWKNHGDYWFPDIRSVGGAIFVLGFALYPYVYMAGLTAFLRQPPNQLHVARTLGRNAWRAFCDVALPQARPALFIGALLVAVECINDLGAATFFGLSTLTTAVYSTWLDQSNLAGAAQLALFLIAAMAAFVFFETVLKERLVRDSKNAGQTERITLTGWRSMLASALLCVAIVIGFLLPLALLISHSWRRLDEFLDAETWQALLNSCLLAVFACITTLLIALFLAYSLRGRSSKLSQAIPRVASLGYVLPGTVLGLGVLIPFGQFDQFLNRVIHTMAGSTPGLILSGGIFTLVFAYTTRFLIISISHVEDGMAKIPQNIDHVARTLGRSKWSVFRSIHLPLLKPSMVAAALLVFVDAMKELPATLILRPFDFETLSTHVFTLASLGQFESAVIPALIIVLAGFIPVIVLMRNLRQRHGQDL